MDGRRIQDRGFGLTAAAASAPGLPPGPSASLQGSLQQQEDPGSTAGDHRCTGRVRMRRWLMTQVISGRYSGLKWIDREKTLLRIPWKHGSRSGWSAEDGKLFESWAIQSGKFDPHHPNARKWKANFRCALRSLPDVEEVKNLSHKTGKDAYKIFRFLPEKQRKRCYKTTRSSWRQTYPPSRSLLKSEVFARPEIPPLTRVPTNSFGIADAVSDRKLTPGDLLHCPVSRDEYHRRLCFPSSSSSSASLDPPDRSSPSSRYWHPPAPPPAAPPSSMSFYRAPDMLLPPPPPPSSIGYDPPAWTMRAHQLPPPGSHPPPPSVFSSVAPYNDVQCDQYANSSFASHALGAVGPAMHGGAGGSSFLGVGAFMTTPDSYVYNNDPYSAGTGEVNDMAAYPAAQFSGEMSPTQPDMTDMSNITSVPQWTNGASEGIMMAELWDVMQAALRDKDSLGNDMLYSDDLEQFEGKPGHP